MRYLQKPITEAQIFECLDISYRQCLFRQGRNIVLTDSNQAVKIDPKTLLYAETQGHYIEIHSFNRKDPIRIRMKLAELIPRLPADYCIQCHRCSIVNLLHIQRFTRTSILLLNGKILPMSARRWELVMLQFKNLFQGEDHKYAMDLV